MAGVNCPKCNQWASSNAALCLNCGALLPLDRPPEGSPTGEGADPWRPVPLPHELRVVIGLIVLELLFFSWIALASTTESTGTVLGCIIFDVALIIDLIRRTPLAWRVAVVGSVIRAASGLCLLSFMSSAGQLDTYREEGLCALVAVGVGISITVLLVVSRARGTYMIQLEGERRLPGQPARSRKTCSRCGDPCPDIDNTWTRAGLCSKRCMERGS